MSPEDPDSVPRTQPRAVYGRSILILSVTSILLSVILLTCAGLINVAPVWRSVLLGAGLVVLSTGLTLFVTVAMYRVAPAATAPALAMLYLFKVVVMGWYLLSVGAPAWLDPRGFAITVAAGLMVSWSVLAPIAMRASAVLARDYTAVMAAKQEGVATRAVDGAPTNLEDSSSEPPEGGAHDRA